MTVPAPHTVSNVILVHGAWADGSSWAKIIPQLAARGMTVTAVQLPLTSFEADVAAVGRALALAQGDVVLVGHSYAGAVIGQAGNDPKVKRLVYIDAFAPDAGNPRARSSPSLKQLRSTTKSGPTRKVSCRSLPKASPRCSPRTSTLQSRK